MRSLRAERPGLVTFASSAVVLLLLVLGWQLTVSLGSIPAYNLPSPSTAFSSLFDNVGMIAGRCGSTLLAALAGLAVSLVVALLLGLVVVQWPALTRAVTTYALLIRTLPIVGVAPLVTLIAGRGIANVDPVHRHRHRLHAVRLGGRGAAEHAAPGARPDSALPHVVLAAAAAHAAAVGVRRPADGPAHRRSAGRARRHPRRVAVGPGGGREPHDRGAVEP